MSDKDTTETVNALSVSKEFKEQVREMDWNTIRQFCKDAGIKIQGLRRPQIEELVFEYKTLSEQSEGLHEEQEVELEDGLTWEEKMTRLIRCKVISLNPDTKGRPSIAYTVGNSKKILPTRIVMFGQISHYPASVVKALQKEQYTRGIPIRVEPNNPLSPIRGMKNVLEKAYEVTILPPLTKEQIANLAKEQQSTGRLRPLE